MKRNKTYPYQRFAPFSSFLVLCISFIFSSFSSLLHFSPLYDFPSISSSLLPLLSPFLVLRCFNSSLQVASFFVVSQSRCFSFELTRSYCSFVAAIASVFFFIFPRPRIAVKLISMGKLQGDQERGNREFVLVIL